MAVATRTPRRRPRSLSAGQYRDLVEQDPDALVVTDVEGRIRLVNAQTEALFDYTRTELLGQSVELLLPERFRGVHQQHRAAYLASPRARPMGANLQLAGRRRDGSEFPVEVALSLLLSDDARGEPLIITNIRDVSEWQRVQAAHAEAEVARAEAERQAAELDLVFGGMNEGLLVYDAEGRLVRTNAVARELLGLDAAPPGYEQLPVHERFAYYHLRDTNGRLLAPQEWPNVRALRGDVLTGEHVMDIRLRSLDGRELDITVSGGPLRDQSGRLVGSVGILRDQTERNRLRRERELADHLLHAHASRTSYELQQRLERERAAISNMMRARDELEAIQAVTDVALSHLHLEDLLSEVLDRVQDIMGVDNVSILLVAADGQSLEVRMALGLEQLMLGSVRVPIGAGFAGRIAATRQPLTVEDTAHFPLQYAAVREQLCSLLGVPLVADEHLLGVLQVGTIERRAFTAIDTQLLEQAGERVAVAIDRAYAYEAVERARDEAERQAEHLDRIFEQMGEGFTLYDAQGLIVRVNAAQRRLLGLDAAPPAYFQTPMEQRIRPYAVCDRAGNPVPPEDWPVARALRGEMATGAEAVDMQLRTLDGRDIEVTASAAPLLTRDGTIIGAVGVVRDQTERNRLAREREEAETRERASRESAQQLDQFFAMASHDIRSPVTALTGNLQIAHVRAERLAAAVHAHDGQDAPLAAVLLEALDRANESGDRLFRLVPLLFDMARARTGTLTLALAPCDLTALVRAQVAAPQTATPERTIQLDLPDHPVPVEADVDRLGQVLTNYLTNALKYSADDCPVKVRLEVTAGLAVVAVRDYGSGLPWDEQSRVWDLYHRAPGVTVQGSAGADSGSLGMGLHICKRLMELHPGGAVGVESVVGEGSTFWFHLPVASGAD